MTPDELRDMRDALAALWPAALRGFALYVLWLAVTVEAIRFLVNGSLP